MRVDLGSRWVLAACMALGTPGLGCSDDDDHSNTGGGGDAHTGGASDAGRPGTAGASNGGAGNDQGGSSAGGANAAAGSPAATGGAAGSTSSAGKAEQVPLSATFTDVESEVAPADLAAVTTYCGDPADPSSLKPFGTVVRAKGSKRYFVCIEDFGLRSAEGVQTNQPGDPTQGFIPYAALFKYSDTDRPNQARPSKGAVNFGLIVLNLLETRANSECRGSNGTFESLKIGGGTADVCTGVPTAYREAGGKKYVDVTFPSGEQQSFVLEPVPFEPL